jgi:hypothetical protein
MTDIQLSADEINIPDSARAVLIEMEFELRMATVPIAPGDLPAFWNSLSLYASRKCNASRQQPEAISKTKKRAKPKSRAA